MTDACRIPGLRIIAPGIAIREPGAVEPEAGRYRLVLAQLGSPGTGRPVFGDGSHPTTRLCAGAVASLCRGHVPAAVLDVGTGTGLLARIARALGATFIVGTDIDPAALSLASANVALDAGSEVGIQLSDAAPDAWGACFDLVVANILEAPLTTLAPLITAALRPGGVLLLSGFTRVQAPRLRVHYEALGLKALREATLDGWLLLQFVRPVTGP
jgi:ribosomal protein L11 methyltransferase